MLPGDEPAGGEQPRREVTECFERELQFVRGLVSRVLVRYRRFVEPLEAQTLALAGLWRTAQRHHRLPQHEFRAVLERRVRGAICDHLRQMSHFTRAARRDCPGATVLEYEERHAPSYELQFDDREVSHERLRQAVLSLRPSQRLVVERRWLAERPALTRELALELGVNCSRVSQLSSAAVANLRRRLAD